MFEGALFDMDGLFVDSEPDWHEAEKSMMKGHGYDWLPADQLKCLGGPLSRVTEYMSNCLNGSKSSAELAAEIIDEMDSRLKAGITLMPGALEFSKKVASLGMPQALVSASPRRLVDAVLSQLKGHHFEFTVAAGDIARTKPYPDPYLHAAKALAIDIRRAIIFEDSPTGLAAAKASGAFTVAIPKFINVSEEPRLKVSKGFDTLETSDLHSWSEINQHELDKSS